MGSDARAREDSFVKRAFESSALFWMKRAALPHRNGSHNGKPSTLLVAYVQAPVWIANASATGPKTKPVAYAMTLDRLGRMTKIAAPVKIKSAVRKSGFRHNTAVSNRVANAKAMFSKTFAYSGMSHHLPV